MIQILYVEDEPLLGKIVKESLESRGFAVQLIGDGDAVVAAFEAQPPDLCVLDVMLPHRDGFSLGQELRQRAPQLPIIFLTAKTQTQDLLKGFQSGGNDYIKKPFSMEELIVRIHNLLNLSQRDAPSGAKGEAIPLGSYTFYPQKYELQHPEGQRSLSHREAQLLGILAIHRNTAVQRKDILLEVWGDDSFFNSRNLDVYIARLRDYLKADDRVRIITLKGVGYHFMVEA
jgi:two-component system, OmpR family, response regulator VicR